MPKVSVVVPNYNHCEYLAQRLDSILQQTFQDFEVIILDDCSTDNSREVIERYRGHPKVTSILYNEKNSGSPFRQWEAGVSIARGDWLWIAESDDYASHLFLETMLGAFKSLENIGLLYCDSHCVIGQQVQSKTFATWKNDAFNTKRWSERHYNAGREEIESFLLERGTINNTSAVLFDREVFLRSKPFDRQFRYVGDKYAFVKVLANSDVGYVELPLNYYRADQGNTPKHSVDFMDYVFEQFHIMDWISRNLPGVASNSLNRALRHNTQSSLISGWNWKKLGLYIDMWRLNPNLFRAYVSFNLARSLRRAIKIDGNS